jgi:hypothetical protein
MAQLHHAAPPILYKYRGTSNFQRDVQCLLRDRQLFLSAPSALNDPFDCKPTLVLPRPEDRHSWVEGVVASAPPGRERDARARSELILSSPKAAERFIEEFYTEDLCAMGVVSLSEPRDNHALWAHYGGEFAGFAVGYRGRDVEAGEALGLWPVSYSNRRPSILPAGDDPDWCSVLHTKSDHWAFEREWRHVRIKDDGGCGLMTVPTGAIVEVCLGPRMPTAHQHTVIEAARALPDRPAVLRAHISRHAFGLEFHSIQ